MVSGEVSADVVEAEEASAIAVAMVVVVVGSAEGEEDLVHRVGASTIVQVSPSLPARNARQVLIRKSNLQEETDLETVVAAVDLAAHPLAASAGTVEGMEGLPAAVTKAGPHPDTAIAAGAGTEEGKSGDLPTSVWRR